MSDITFASSTLLLSLNISCWSGNKLDKSETEALRQRTGSKRGAGRVHKSLLPDAQELADLKAHETLARNHFNARTAAWSGDMRIARSDTYLTLAQELAEFKRNHYRLIDILCDAYSLRVYEAERSLGTMHNPADYPDVGTIRAACSFQIRVAPTPSVRDWRLDLNDQVMADLRKDLEAQSTSAMGTALADVAKRIAGVARKAHEKLADPVGVFRDTLVGNIDELVGLLPVLNITNDPALDDLATSLRLSVFGVTPDKLRHDPVVRSEKAKEMDQLAANAEQLADMFARR